MNEVRDLKRRLSGIKIKARETVRKVRVSGASRDASNLPSYLRDNPWIEILLDRR